MSHFKDAADLFDKLAAGIAIAPERARALDATYCFKIAGGGTWTVDCRADPPTVAEGDAGQAQCAIKIDRDDFMRMLDDPNLGMQRCMQLYFQGKLHVSGDPMLAMKLQSLFELAISK